MSFTCTPKEVGLYEWKLDRDKVYCIANIQNNGPRVQIAPRVVIDDIETFWLNIETVPEDSPVKLKYDVKFDDELAQMMYGPSATALSFVRTVEKHGGTVCHRGACYNTTRIYYLPENHSISLRIYKAEHRAPTTRVLTQTTKETITVKDDNYILKRTIIIYKEIGKRTVPIVLGVIGIECRKGF
ncbi:hypothetical protein JCM16138_09390 [Thermococcus atlanticus]